MAGYRSSERNKVVRPIIREVDAEDRIAMAKLALHTHYTENRQGPELGMTPRVNVPSVQGTQVAGAEKIHGSGIAPWPAGTRE